MRKTGPQASEGWRLFAGAAAVAIVTLFFFSPRFVVWRGLDVPLLHTFPEVNRAAATWAQAQAPLAEITDPSNLVLRWRLLFPLLAYLTGMPRWAFLALPALGAVLALAFVLRLLRDGGFAWGAALGGALALATTSWFLVSTGWLAYFDSWCLLGMLATAFGRRRWAAVAVLATPWVDERFVLALPLCLWCRCGSGVSRATLTEAAKVGALVLPWFAVRAGVFLFSDKGFTGTYVQLARQAADQIEIGAYAEGMWQGLRWAWLAVGCWLAAQWRKSRVDGGLTTLLAVGTFGVTHFIAADLCRSAIVLVPAVVSGLLVLPQLAFGRATTWIVAVCALNLVFPAKHIVLNGRAPIFYFHTELANWRNPPPTFTGAGLANLAVERMGAGALNDAGRNAEAAVQLEPTNSMARTVRGVVNYRSGKTRAAREDFDAALAIEPALHLARLNRAVLHMEAGALEAARGDLLRLQREAPADWPQRTLVKGRLEELDLRLNQVR